MKIWIDRASAFQPVRGDCTCPIYPVRKEDEESLSLAEDLESIQTGLFKRATGLYIQESNCGRWLVSHPIGSGRIAVLDSSAYFLFEQFKTPATFVEVMQAVANWRAEAVLKAIAFFLKLGFLQNLRIAAPVNAWEEEDILTVWMHVTNVCNLRCPYCYLQKTSENMPDDISLKSVETVFRSASKHNIKRVKLKYAGGEASLSMKHVTTIHDYAVQVARGYEILLDAVLLSNGVALSQRTIEILKTRQIMVMISLDGLGGFHDSQRPFVNGRGSFQYVARTIERLIENALIPHISITVSHRNLEGLPDLMEYILERDMPFTINYYRENECSMHLRDLRFQEEMMIATMRSVFGVIERYLPQRSLLGSLIDRADAGGKHRHTCSVGRNYLVIDQNGGVAKCQEDIKRRITTIEADDPLQLIRDDRSGVQGLSVEDKEECRTCEWRYWCAGGCPLMTYKVTGRFDVKSPNCNIYKALFPEVLRLEALRLLRYSAAVDLSACVDKNAEGVTVNYGGRTTYEEI